MSYHDLSECPLSDDERSESTLSDDERSEERNRLVGMLLEVEHRMTNAEQSFVSGQRRATWKAAIDDLREKMDDANAPHGRARGAGGKGEMKREMRVARSIAGPVLLEFGNILNGVRIALSDQDAIRLCDAIRDVLEQPTQGQPRGENVIIMPMSNQ